MNTHLLGFTKFLSDLTPFFYTFAHTTDCSTGGKVFTKTGPPPSPPEVTSPKRHSMDVISDAFSFTHVEPTRRTKSPHSDDGKRRRKRSPYSDEGKSSRKRSPEGERMRRGRSKTNAGTVNVAFSLDVPDIKIRDYVNSDEELSV